MSFHQNFHDRRDNQSRFVFFIFPGDTSKSLNSPPNKCQNTGSLIYAGYKYTPATPGSDRTVNTIQVQTCLPLCSLGCRATRNMFQSRLLFHHCSLKEKHKGATQAAKQNCPTQLNFDYESSKLLLIQNNSMFSCVKLATDIWSAVTCWAISCHRCFYYLANTSNLYLHFLHVFNCFLIIDNSYIFRPNLTYMV